jgi:ferredoxin-NADP reductase/predicted pyridoxine 5'-phosphate oxidase superfamily flavin-nucleotide-binding protein
LIFNVAVNTMHKIQDISELEALVGKPPALVMMKQIPRLDEGCIRLLAHSPVAGFGYITETGMHFTTMVGGTPGFVRVESPTSVSFDVPIKLSAPKIKSGASFVFLLPGVGEILRLNGTVAAFSACRVTITVEEALIHCARAILRSRLWSEPVAESPLIEIDNGAGGAELLGKQAIANFIAASPFVLLSSWDAQGASDTSPRGDGKGFLRLLDPGILSMPDRQGNQRTDTFHNIISNNQVSLVALVPGSNKLLHLSGHASITNEESLLDTMSLNGKPPQAALLLDVKNATITDSEALAQAQLWLQSAHVDPRNVPDMMALALHHLALNESAGRTGRFLGRLLSGSPKFVRTLMNLGYRSQLKNEGYAAPETSEKPKVKRKVLALLAGKLSPNVRQKIQECLYRFSDHLSRTAKAFEDDTQGLPVAQANLLTREVSVVEVRKETHAAVTLVVEDIAGESFEFKPGQFFTLFMNVNGKQVIRSYSASNAPGTKQLCMTVKRIADGLCSTHVNQHLKPGDNLALRGPSGTFYVIPEPTASREYILIASGSGITPMMSIAQTVLTTEPASTITLLYGNRRWEDVIFAQAWADLCQTYPDRLRVRHLLSAPHGGWVGGSGRLDESTTRRELLNLAPSLKAHYYVCGPEPMMQGVTAALSGMGITADLIHTERFGQIVPPDVNTELQPYISQYLIVMQHGKALGKTEIPSGQTLLQAGLNAQLPLPFSCGMGNCGECRVKLADGEVTMTEPNCLSTDDRRKGYILTCVARPLTTITIVLEQ